MQPKTAMHPTSRFKTSHSRLVPVVRSGLRNSYQSPRRQLRREPHLWLGRLRSRISGLTPVCCCAKLS